MSELQANTLKPRTGSTIQIGTTGSHTLAVGDASNAADLDVKGTTQLRGGLDCEGVAEFDSAVTIDSSLGTTGNITVTGANITAAAGTITCDTLVAENITLTGGSATITPIFAGGPATKDGSNWNDVEGEVLGGSWGAHNYNWGYYPEFTFDAEQGDANYMVIIGSPLNQTNAGAMPYVYSKGTTSCKFLATGGQPAAIEVLFVRLV